MNLNRLIRIAVVLGFVIATNSTNAMIIMSDEPRTLQVDEETPIVDVAQSRIGYRSTLLFYTFVEQRTVLKFELDNKDKSFPISGTVMLFDEEVTKEGLDKWINNQHSDGLWADAPKPSKQIKIPEEVCKVTKHELIDKTRIRTTEYENYSVEFRVEDFTDMANVRIKSFEGKSKVHLPVKD